MQPGRRSDRDRRSILGPKARSVSARSSRPGMERLEERLALSSLPFNFSVPGVLANKGVYVGIFGSLQNGQMGYTNVPPYTPSIGPSAGTPLNGGNWVYLSSNVSASTTLGASTSLVTNFEPSDTSIVVTQGGTTPFPSAGTVLMSGPGQKAALNYTGKTANSFTGVSFVDPSKAQAFLASNGITVAELEVPLGASTIPVASTAGFATSGVLMVEGQGTNQVLYYTGTTTNSFTGVTGGKGGLPGGARVIAMSQTGAVDYALAPAGQNLPLINLFPNPGTYPNSNQLVTATLNIPDQAVAPITSGQMVMSVGTAMALPVDAKAGTIASPDVGTNPNDKFGLFEWGWDSAAGATPSGVLDIDVSEVDQVGFNFTATTSPAMPPPAQDGTGLIPARDVLFNSFGPYLKGLNAASNASVFLAGDPKNTLTTFAPGTRITAPQDITTKLEVQPPIPEGKVTQNGSLAIGSTYYYAITAVSASGESMASVPVAIVPYKGSQGGADVFFQTANLSWPAYPYAQSYKVYRSQSLSGGQLVSPVLMGTITTPTKRVFVDNGSSNGTAATPPTNNYNYDPLNQYFTTAIKDFFDYYATNDFVLDLGGADKTTFKGRTTSITIGPNTYPVLQLTGQSGQYGGQYAGLTANIYLPIFSTNTNGAIPGITNYPAPPSWLVDPNESPSSMIFGCDGVFDTPDNTGVPVTSAPGVTLPTATLTVTTGGTAGFAPQGTLLVAGPGNTSQVVSYTGINSTTNSFTGVTGGTGTFTSAIVYGLSATTASFTNNLTLPLGSGAVLPVPSTTGFPGQGALVIQGTGASNQNVTYTGIQAAAFQNVLGGSGTFSQYTATATLAPSSISTVPTATVKDIMNAIASAFNRGITPQKTGMTWSNVLPPSYWGSDPNPLQGSAATGGTLATGKYRYVITALNINSAFSATGNAETTPSNEIEVTLSGTNNAVKLSWPAINLPGGPIGAMTAQSFNIYRSVQDAATGAFGPLLLIKKGLTNGPTDPTTTFTDTSPDTVSPATSPPFVYYANGSTANFYSGFLHQRHISINGLAYGFPYDDQGGFSTNVQMPTPTNVTITLGNWTNATTLKVTPPASPPIAGSSAIFTVTAQDGTGSVVTDYVGTVYFSTSDAQAGLPNAYTFQASDKGKHAFTVTFKTTGAQTLTVLDPANDFMGSAKVTVQPGPPIRLSFLKQPVWSLLGSTIQVSVEALDAFGNLATEALGPVRLRGLTTNSTAMLEKGIARFNLPLTRLGQFRLSAAAAFASAVSSRSFEVSNATRLRVTNANPATVGQPLTLTITAIRPSGLTDRFYDRLIDVFQAGKKVGTAIARDGIATVTLTPSKAGRFTFLARDDARNSLFGVKTINVMRAG